MTYKIDEFLALIQEIRSRGEITISREQFGHAFSAISADLAIVLKNAGYRFVRDVPTPGVVWIQIDPKQIEIVSGE